MVNNKTGAETVEGDSGYGGVGVGVWVLFAEVASSNPPRYISKFGLRGNSDGRGVVRTAMELYARLWADLALSAIAFNGVR